MRDDTFACDDMPAVIDTVYEAYSWLRVGEAARVLFRHDYADESHPVVWTYVGSVARSAYCALGHDVEAYESPAVRRLVGFLARWAAAAEDTRTPSTAVWPQGENAASVIGQPLDPQAPLRCCGSHGSSAAAPHRLWVRCRA